MLLVDTRKQDLSAAVTRQRLTQSLHTSAYMRF